MIRLLLRLINNFAPRTRHSVLRRFPRLHHFLRSCFDSLPLLEEGQVQFAKKEWKSVSQARQDVFVQIFGEHHEYWTYLEIGAANPEQGNNTFLLEKSGWIGISLEIDDKYTSEWKKSRTNQLMIADALEVDYDSILSKISSTDGYIGYLQVDIEPASASLEALKKAVISPHRFCCITFEHDAYRFGDQVRHASRKLATELGYRRIVSDVEWSPGSNFEDWWIDPGAFPSYLAKIQDDTRWFSKETERQIQWYSQNRTENNTNRGFE